MPIVMAKDKIQFSKRPLDSKTPTPKQRERRKACAEVVRVNDGRNPFGFGITKRDFETEQNDGEGSYQRGIKEYADFFGETFDENRREASSNSHNQKTDRKKFFLQCWAVPMRFLNI